MNLDLILLAIVGAFAGGQINRAIYRLAWKKRSISPWSSPPTGCQRRTWRDCLPIIGWPSMRREQTVHGHGFWVRPMLLELCCACGLPALYWWHVSGQILPIGVAPPPAEIWTPLFARHAVFFVLMLVATFIDLDEQTIPDEITIPGTIAALVLAVTYPRSLLPVDAGGAADRLLATDPSEWPAWLNTTSGLLIGLICFGGWCLAMLPYTVTLRKGWLKGLAFFIISPLRFIAQSLAGRLLMLIWFVGSIAIGIVWRYSGQGGWTIAWESLLSCLIGLAFGGGMVWGVRIVAGNVLGKEAMGFGDVTLMAMIGAFVGWQPSLIAFFIAPFAGVVIAVSHYLLSGRHDIAFGPYLCFGAAIVVMLWRDVWERWGPIFALGAFIPLTVGVCILLMGLMLLGWRGIQRLLGFDA